MLSTYIFTGEKIDHVQQRFNFLCMCVVCGLGGGTYGWSLKQRFLSVSIASYKEKKGQPS